MRAKRIDENQNRIVKCLRDIPGVTVQSLAEVGRGCPDLLVGFRGRNYLLELKDGDKPPSARKLTPDQQVWHSEWCGQVYVATNSVEALREIGALP